MAAIFKPNRNHIIYFFVFLQISRLHRPNFWYNVGDLIREEGITLMRGDVLVFVARSDSRHILFED